VGGDDRIRGAASGLVAAALFGASAPLSKLLLPGSDPLALAGLLYMGAGLGLSLQRFAVRRVRPVRRAEARLRRRTRRCSPELSWREAWPLRS
jgi:drug/metabolite transporter (DMT)-like permease